MAKRKGTKLGAKVLREVRILRELYEEVKDLLGDVDYCLAQATGYVEQGNDEVEGIFRLNEAKDNFRFICTRINKELAALPATLAEKMQQAKQSKQVEADV